MSKLCIYHDPCNDGFCAAYLFWKSYPDAEFHPSAYGDAPPDVTGKDVVIADFSYSREVMLDLAEKANSVIVLDHHKTAQANFEGLEHPKLRAVFDMTKSGARLMQDYLYPQQTSVLVDYIEDRDLWHKKLEESDAISAYISSFPRDFKSWDDIEWTLRCPEGIKIAAAEGRAILRSNQQQIDKMVERACMTSIAGYNVPIVNSTNFQSEIGNELAKTHQFAAVYFILDKSPAKIVFSLRSEKSNPNHMDVSEIAKMFGGGGHKHAAGFTLTLNQFWVDLVRHG